MPIEVQFYILSPKPISKADKSMADGFAGKEPRGRRWYRLEGRPDGTVLFPDDADALSIIAWVASNPWRGWVAFLMRDEFYPLENEAISLAVQGADAAVRNAISAHKNGRPGWIVFIKGDDNA